MAKVIRLTPAEIDAVINEFKDKCEEFKNSLRNSVGNKDIKFEFKKKCEDTIVDGKAKIILTSKAWMKTKLLVDKFSTEVGWYYVADRGENENEYILSDVYVFPQEVTGATVRMDIGETQKWIFEIPDEVYSRFRGHGHSHNSMGTTPSGQDIETRISTIETQPDDGFYVFLIWNKRYEVNLTVLDLAANIQFENKDCEFEVQDEDGYLQLLDDAERYVKKSAPTTPKGTGGYYGNHGYKGSYNTSSNNNAKPEEKKIVPINSQKDEKKDPPKEKKVVNADEDYDYLGDYYDDPYGYGYDGYGGRYGGFY